MDLDKKPWIKAGLLGAAVSVGFSFITSVLGRVLGSIPFLACINCLLAPVACVLWIIVPGAAGFIASKWAQIKRGDTETAMKQGALAGLTLGIVGGIINFVIQIIFEALNITYTLSLSALTEQNDQLSDLAFLPLGIGGAIVCGLFGLLIGIAFDVIFGLLGGIIYSSTAKE